MDTGYFAGLVNVIDLFGSRRFFTFFDLPDLLQRLVNL